MTHNRLPNESNKAWEAAKIYFEMGHDRSLDSVGKKLSKSLILMGRWSARHSWVERARSWDTEQEDILARGRAKAQEAENKKWAKRRAEAAEKDFQAAEALRELSRKMMAYPLSKQTTTKDGKSIVVQPAKWGMSDAISATKAATELNRLACNLPTTIAKSEVSGPEGGPIEISEEISTIEIPPNGRDDKKD